MSAYTIQQDDIVNWLHGRQWLFENGFLPKYHAVFCDPPYALSFMGKDFDKFSSPQVFQAWVTEWGSLLLSAVYPGAMGLFFGGTRTYHRLAAGLEDAGWEIVDCMMFMYGSGFPKSLDISKAIDREAGAEREVIGYSDNGSGAQHSKLTNHGTGDTGIGYADGSGKVFDITAPATDAARQWDGYKTHLKPAYEPVIVARAPRDGYTFAQLAQRFGTGALAVDACRIGTNGETIHLPQSNPAKRNGVVGKDLGISTVDLNKMHESQRASIEKTNMLGRYPANVILGCACEGDQHEETCPVRVLDEQSGECKSGGRISKAGDSSHTTWRQLENRSDNFTRASDYEREPSTGGASRFFYTAKAGSWEREAGLDGFESKQLRESGNEFGKMTIWNGENGSDEWKEKNPNAPRRNIHPTVKPIDLCQYIARLICPPQLDEPRRLLIPFAGSGSECIGAALAGWDEITGIERESEYAEIARARLAWWAQFKSIDDAKAAYDVTRQREETARHVADKYGLQQLDMFSKPAA